MNVKRFRLMEEAGGQGGAGGGAGGGTGGGAPSIAWLPNADADTVGFIQNKAWQSPADAIAGYRNLETLIGADRAGRTVTIPKDDTDTAGWTQLYDKLGRPANPADYKLPVPEGQDPAFSQAVAAKFHELGIPGKAGVALATWWNEQVATAMQAEAAASQQAYEAEAAQLKKDWGSEQGMRTELAKRAAVKLGLDEASIDALEKVAGFSKTMKALAKVGDMLREHGAEGMNDLNLGSFGMTPEGAKARRGQLMADEAWRKKAMDPKSAEWAELSKLDKIISDADAAG